MWKRIGIGVAAVLGVLVLAIGAFVVFFPKAWALADIERRVEAATERDLTLGGDVDLTFWPELGFSANQASLSNPQGFSDTPFLAADRIVFAVKVLPLFSGRVEVKKLIFEGAELQLEAKQDGAANWTFPTDESQPNDIGDLKFDELRFVRGRITFQGDDGSPPLVLENVDAELALKSLDQAAALDANFDYRGERVEIDADIGVPRAVLEKRQTPFVVRVHAAPLDANFDGAFDAASGALTGRVTAEGASLRRLMAWTGSPMAEGPGFAAFRVEAQMAHDGAAKTSLRDAAIRVDATGARGTLDLTSRRNGRMLVSANLTAPSIDLNPYLPAPAQGAGGVSAGTAWPSDRIDLSGLRAVDAELAFATPELKFQRMTFTDTRMTLRIANGAADARLSHIALYGGAGWARLIADGSGATPRVAVELDARDIQSLPFLRDAVGFDKIEGKGRIVAALAGQGASQAAIMRSLRGSASFTFNDGQWRGVNLAVISRQVNALLTGEAAGPSATTDFSELAARFTVSNGVAATDNLRLLSPYVRMEGAGVVDIGAQSLDMRLEPRAVRSAQGQGATDTPTSYGIPFRVTGSWTRPSFRPAIGDAVRNEIAQRARDVLRTDDGRSPLGQLGTAIFGSSAGTPAPTPPADTTTTTSTDAATATTTTTDDGKQKDRPRNPLEELFRRN